jgi:malignant T-cell-amplified sequence
MYLMGVAFHDAADPDVMPIVQVDKGAIKFILSGANIMCPGLTSPGAKMEEDLEEGSPVVSPLEAALFGLTTLQAVYAEGKEHAIAVGCLTKSTAAMWVRFETR